MLLRVVIFLSELIWLWFLWFKDFQLQHELTLSIELTLQSMFLWFIIKDLQHQHDTLWWFNLQLQHSTFNFNMIPRCQSNTDHDTLSIGLTSEQLCRPLRFSGPADLPRIWPPSPLGSPRELSLNCEPTWKGESSNRKKAKYLSIWNKLVEITSPTMSNWVFF